ELELPADFDRLYDEQPVISGFDMARGLAPEWLADRSRLSEYMRTQVEQHIDVSRAPYTEAQAHAAECRSRFSRVLSEHGVDALLTPSAPDEAPKGLGSTGDALFNRNWTLLHV